LIAQRSAAILTKFKTTIAIIGSTVPTIRTVAKSIEMNVAIESARGTCEDFRSIVFEFRAITLNFHDGRADSARITVTYSPE
jgi:hypothetical protein